MGIWPRALDKLASGQYDPLFRSLYHYGSPPIMVMGVGQTAPLRKCPKVIAGELAPE